MRVDASDVKLREPPLGPVTIWTVIEIRLVAPRPNLLPLLAQPEFAILRGAQGTGPFKLARDPKEPRSWRASLVPRRSSAS